MNINRETISRKQVGVIYRAVKEGKLDATKEEIGCAYDMTEIGYGQPVGARTEEIIRFLKATVDEIFNGDAERAQAMFDIAMNRKAA